MSARAAVRSLLFLAGLTACSAREGLTGMPGRDAGQPAPDSGDIAPPPPAPRPDAASAPDAGVSLDGSAAGALDSGPAYVSIVDLHEKGIARTCALNGGVCHNSKNYPDIHTTTALLEAVNRPCNLTIDNKANVKDPCEPSGDHLVIPSQNVDVEIATATISNDLNTAILTLVTAASPGPQAMDAEIHRRMDDGSMRVWILGAASGAALVTITASKTATFDLTNATADAKTFLDSRTYPRAESFVWEADPNRNGIYGASLGWKMIKPGDPARSFLLGRLYDTRLGELMPRQCRTWDDVATSALACWIEGLKVDGNGAVLNAYDPIDYASCSFHLPNHGKCSQDTPPAGGGLAAVETIAQRSCAGAGCHTGPSPAAGLDLSPGRVKAALVGVAAAEAPDMKRVQPGNLEASYLWCKVEDTCAARGASARMPRGTDPLSDQDLAAIRDWITSGAE